MPDALYYMAEETACRLKISRSQLYATAIADFLEPHEDATET
jgi:hypothetical protein